MINLNTELIRHRINQIHDDHCKNFIMTEFYQKQLYQTTFAVSAPTLKLCPSDTGFEVAFAGRSNAGKSSAINTLTNQKQLARSSKTPQRDRKSVV